MQLVYISNHAPRTGSDAVIENDDRRYVAKVSHEFWDGGEILVEVEELYDKRL